MEEKNSFVRKGFIVKKMKHLETENAVMSRNKYCQKDEYPFCLPMFFDEIYITLNKILSKCRTFSQQVIYILMSLSVVKINLAQPYKKLSEFLTMFLTITPY